MKKNRGGLIALGVIVALLVVSAISNVSLSSKNSEKIKGQFQSCVYIGEECMNVYQDGKGDKTIVIIPDVDVLVPFIEYRPLMDQLAVHYKVVLIEPFGKGLSDITNNERSKDQIISEIHSAIRLSNVEEPYILMSLGHANLYALSYLNQYEDEVEMYVAIDPSVPNEVDHIQYKSISSAAGILQKLGIARLAKVAMPEVLAPSKYNSAYSQTQWNTMMEVAAIKYGNANIVEETKSINALMESSKSMKLPTTIPTLAFVSSYDADHYDWWLPEINAFFVESDICKVNVMQTYQYMHRKEYHEIEVDLGRFIEGLYSEENENQEN